MPNHVDVPESFCQANHVWIIAFDLCMNVFQYFKLLHNKNLTALFDNVEKDDIDGMLNFKSMEERNLR
ncbi:MAG: hypothetical protein LBS55_11450 [Prevotellaceae bacterium]|jgi:hypothetical protein|nr:hypothetical protein [Prevotellaceae bacterium]